METDQTNQIPSTPPIQNSVNSQPPVESNKNNSAKFAFFYILSLIALIFMAISVGVIIFQIINKEIADIINDYSGRYSDEAMKMAISAIIIATPIYYLISRQIYKSLYKGALDIDSGIRKWLTYLILLIAAIVMIVNVIGTINGLLGGELTTKSILKTITVLAIAGTVFAFYFYDIRREKVKDYKDKMISIFAYTSLAIVLIVFTAAWFFVESPSEARNRKIDREVINDLNNIHFVIRDYYGDNKELPKNLVTLEEYKTPFKGILEDSIELESYEYEIIADDEYKICTEFTTSNLEEFDYKIPGYTSPQIELHDKGHQCFNRQVKTVYDSTVEREPIIIR